MRWPPVGLRDARVALGVVVGMLLAGFVLPLASPDPEGASGPEAASTFAPEAPGEEPVADERPTTAPAGEPTAPAAGGPTAPGVGGDAPVGDDPVSGEPAAPGEGGEPAEPGQSPARSGDSGAQSETGDGEVERTASDQGVTAETIKLGVALINLDAVSATGVAASNGTTEERRRVWEALVAGANERGGAVGRTIELVTDDFDPLQQGEAMQTCRRLTEDEQVFAVSSGPGWVPEAALCVTREHGVPNLAYDAYDLSVYQQAGGLLWSTLAGWNRMAYNDAMVLHERGLLEGRTIGLTTLEGFSEAPDETLIPTLEQFGYSIEHHSELSENPSTAQSQIPVEINQMRSKGVDFIIFYAGPSNSNFWLNQTQKQNYHPTYAFSDFNSGADSFSVQAVEEEVDAHVFGTRRKYELPARESPPEADEACVRRVEERTGMEIEPEEDLYYETVRFCGHLSAFVQAADASGPNPTRERFAGAVANLGQRPDASVGPAGTGGSWQPDKPGAADHVLPMEHDVSCRCWVPTGADWFPMRRLGG